MSSQDTNDEDYETTRRPPANRRNLRSLPNRKRHQLNDEGFSMTLRTRSQHRKRKKMIMMMKMKPLWIGILLPYELERVPVRKGGEEGERENTSSAQACGHQGSGKLRIHPTAAKET